MPDTHGPGEHTLRAHERRVASGGLTLVVREYGELPAATAGPHVVLVHGYPDSQEMGRPVGERLAGDGITS